MKDQIPDNSSEVITWPSPLIIAPKRLPHKQTFIVLHGRGDHASSFAPGLLSTTFDSPFSPSSPDSSTTTTTIASSTETQQKQVFLQTLYPHARWVFPTAPKRKIAASRNKASFNQWFDSWRINSPHEHEALQFKGLRESATFVHGLLREEIARLEEGNDGGGEGGGGSADDVVLWGLSQGGATSLTAMLLWEGERIGAMVGMCTYLPLRGRMEGVRVEGEEAGRRREEQDKTGDRVDDEHEKGNGDRDEVTRDVVRFLATTIELEKEQQPVKEPSLVFQKVPFFLGHGTVDETVGLFLGIEVSKLLPELGASVDFKLYEGLHHWYSPSMLKDIVVFLDKAGIHPEKVLA